jgi:Sulfotransferase family
LLSLKSVKKRLLKKSPKAWRGIVANYKNWKISRSPFFRLHRYAGPLSYKSVDAYSAVDPQLRIFFHRIPKSANSSVVASITQLRQGKSLPSGQDFKREVRQMLVRPSALSEAEAANAADLFKFVFVRDPYSRALSAYLSKVKGPWKIDRQIREDIYSTSALDSGPPSFEEFCRFLRAGGLYRNHHWWPQVDFLLFPVDRYDLIGRVESIDADFKRLAKHVLGNATFDMLEEDPAHRTGATELTSQYYTPELYDLIHDVYKSDFEAFGYPRHGQA